MAQEAEQTHEQGSQVKRWSGGRRGWVRALHLEGWADRLDSRGVLPILVRRLIRATAKELQWSDFPSREQVQRPGWDGLVVTHKVSTYVPVGTSVWEMGVDKAPGAKANEDFVKRSKEPLGLDPSQTTFVFVTPRKWQNKNDWVEAKLALGMWKNVCVFDSATLEEWLESAPAVSAWLAEMLGIKPAGIIALDEYWANLQGLTEPSLTHAVFLASREAQVGKLDGWFNLPDDDDEVRGTPPDVWPVSSASAMAIEAGSPPEAIDFIVAYCQAATREEFFSSRSLIIENREAWRAMTASDEGLLLIAHHSLPLEPELVAEAVRRGHRVLFPTNSPQRKPVATLKLPRIYPHDLESALRSSGLDEEKARRVAREAGGSLAVLKRLLARYPGNTQPDWCRASEASSLIPLLLAGSWDEDSEADRRVIERLSGIPYSGALGWAGRWQQSSDPPFLRSQSRWRLVSRDDSWFLLGASVTANNLKLFEGAALDVLSEDNPYLGLPLWERALATHDGKQIRYSPSLRQGVAETLAILGAQPGRLAEETGVRGLADRVVRSLLDGQGHPRWASLSDELPWLAEASPREFLHAVEKDLRRDEPTLIKMFHHEGGPVFGSSPHTGLLWALETLAWDRLCLSRVSRILATLDEMAPNSQSGNSPTRSLITIFMPWLPQTTASVDERIQVLRKLMEHRPDSGWRLVMELLSSRHQVSSPTARPKWRDWSLTWTGGASHADYWCQMEAYAHLLAGHIGEDVSRWEALVRQFANLPPQVRGVFIGQLAELAEGELGGATRRALSDGLRETIARHQRHKGTNWALADEVLSELEEVRARLEPDDPILRNAWLFGGRWRDFAILDGHAEQFEESRRIALSQVIRACGWPGVLELVKIVEVPYELGLVLAGSPQFEASIIPGQLSSSDDRIYQFARGYVCGRFSRCGWDWAKNLQMRGWSTEQIGGLLVLLPCNARTWELAAAHGSSVVAWYWEHTPPYHTWEKHEEATAAVSMLLAHGRPTAAIHVIGMAYHDKLSIEPSLLMDALQSLLDHWSETEEQADSTLFEYEVQQIFHALHEAVRRGAPALEVQRLSRLEWGFLGLLHGDDCSPDTLHGLLRDDPNFFVQVLGLVFRPKHVPIEEAPEQSVEERQRALHAFRLLEAWRGVPGLREDGTVDRTRLLDWIGTVRHDARERDLLEVCDTCIGQVFAHAPDDPDGTWPCIPVRDALEDIGTENVFTGFGVGIYNKRGVTWRSAREGGDQERSLAEKYRCYAEACHVNWPGTADKLREMAEGFEEDARRQDAWAAHD